MTLRMLCFLALGLLASIRPLRGAEPVSIVVSADDKTPLLAGQKRSIMVDLLTQTTFATAVSFDLPEIPGAVLMRLSDRPMLGTREIEGTSYAVQTHELAFFGLRAGTYAIPAFSVRFASPDTFGGPPVDRTLHTQPLSITTTIPPGTEFLPGIVCGHQFGVAESWSPEVPKTLRVGDSLTRTITSTADDIPGMVFPPIPVLNAPELKAYPQPPQVSDRSERGTFTGQRVDRLTYICQKPGRVSLPELVIPWWSLDDNALQEIRLPAVSFEVLPAGGARPSDEAVKPAAVSRSKWRRAWPAAAGGLLLLSAGVILGVRRHRAQAGSPGSIERSRFRDLSAACAADDPVRAHDALFRWAAAASGRSLTTCEQVAAWAGPSLARPLADLERDAALGTSWDGQPLASELSRHRGVAQTAAKREPEALPPLNP